MERLQRAPRHVVLSACESGLPDVRPGDEQLGLAAALLAMGTTSLVATVLPVPDELSHAVMLRFDGHRRRRLDPASALARAQQELPAAAAFRCFGAG
ncbi:CHAT domain-containing protein [Pseudonocardia sp. GCM10023141]|uniref:CHAT domain-containing protein n=1 Tax=Pseudonocardia sp. GCM10023141 TaxID=3252653 RepID=UPI00360B697C